MRTRWRTSSESSRGGSALWEGTKKHQNIRHECFDSVNQSLMWTCRLTRLPWKMGCSPQPISDPRPRRIKTMVKDRTQHVGYLFKVSHLNWNCDIVNILILESFVWSNLFKFHQLSKHHLHFWQQYCVSLFIATSTPLLLFQTTTLCVRKAPG